jgi:hypothetical protein
MGQNSDVLARISATGAMGGSGRTREVLRGCGYDGAAIGARVEKGVISG